MAYTLTQARVLLTAAELELFDQSRAAPIQDLTPARLAGKVKRARTLRDKYRDLYRRQTVAVRGESAVGRPADGSDNARTQRKADIFQEVLERFEAHTLLLETRSEREAAAKPRATKPVAAGTKAAAAASVKTAAPATKKAAGSKSKSSTAAPAAAEDVDAAPVTAARKKAGAAPARSTKAPSRKAPTAGSKAQAPQVNAPLDTVASAERASPLKQDPGNIAIHAHQSSSARRTQGKRDSR